MVKVNWGALAAEDEEVQRKGPWTVDEDMKLIRCVSSYGERRWDIIAKLAGLRRTGRSCRMRWVNYLRPDVKHGHITPEEQRLIMRLHARWGNGWSRIAQRLPGRTDNEIKNYWRTHIKKKAEANHRCCNSLNNNINDRLDRERNLTSSVSATTMSSDREKATPDASSTLQITEDIFDMQCIRRSNSLPEIRIIEEVKEDRELGLQRGICDTFSDPEFYDGGRPSELHDDDFTNTLPYDFCSAEELSLQLSGLYEDSMPQDGQEFTTSFFMNCTEDFSNEDHSFWHYYSDALWNFDDDNQHPP